MNRYLTIATLIASAAAVLTACANKPGEPDAFATVVGTAAYYTLGTMARASDERERANTPTAPDIDPRFLPYAISRLESAGLTLGHSVPRGWLDNDRLLVEQHFAKDARPDCNPRFPPNDVVCIAIWHHTEHRLDFDIRVEYEVLAANRRQRLLVVGPKQNETPFPSYAQYGSALTPEDKAAPDIKVAGESYKLGRLHAVTPVGRIVAAAHTRSKDQHAFINRRGQWFRLWAGSHIYEPILPSPDGCKVASFYSASRYYNAHILIADLCAAFGIESVARTQ